MASEAKQLKSVKGERKKISVVKIDLASQPVGFAFSGKFIGTTVSAPFNVATKEGEIIQKTMTTAIFENVDNAERFAVVQDAGLKSGMQDAMVREGQLIEVVKLEKVKLSKGRTMNQYDIFSLQ